MRKKISLLDREIEYELRQSRRARRLRLVVRSDAGVIVTLPFGASENIVDKFMRAKAAWILEKINHFKERGVSVLHKTDRRDFIYNKIAALRFVQERVEYYNKSYGYDFKKISIRNQASRWGSCSRKGNLNFNYKIIFLPPEQADYIIVHELCHLGELNHSKKFWNLVAKTFPDYQRIRKELRGI